MIQVTLPLPVFDRLAHENRLAPSDVPALEALVYRGIAPSDTLRRKLRKVPRYVAWYRAILSAISEAYFAEKGIRFPPPEYKAPRNYRYYVA